MSIPYQQALHQQLIDKQRIAIAWGLSRDATIQLKRAPYCFHAIVDGRSEPDSEPVSFEGLPVVSPFYLSQFKPQDIVIVVFADVKSFGAEIAAQIRELGDYEMTTPIDYWRNFSVAMMQQRYAKAIEMSKVEVDKCPDDTFLLCIHKLCKGGAEKQLVWLALGLRQLGYRVELMTFLPDEAGTKEWDEQLFRAGVTRILPAPIDASAVYEQLDKLGVDRNFHTIYSGFYLTAFVTITAHLKRQQPMAVISFLDGINVTLASACRLTGYHRAIMSGRNYAPVDIPNLVSTINLDAVKAIYLDVLRHKKGHLSCNSVPGAASYAHWLGMQEDEVSVIHNYLHIGTFEPVDIRHRLAVPESAVVVCGVMRLAVEKRPDLFIEVFSKVAANIDGLYGVIIGDGYLRGEIERSIQIHGMADRIFLLGTVESAIPFMAECDALLHTAVIEGMPNVIMEAMALQLPVIAYEIPSITAIAQPDATLSLSPVENISDMSAQLEKVSRRNRSLPEGYDSHCDDRLTDYAARYVELAVSLSDSCPVHNEGRAN